MVRDFWRTSKKTTIKAYLEDIFALPWWNNLSTKYQPVDFFSENFL